MIYIFEGYRSIVFCTVLRFWDQGKTGLIKWVMKSFLFYFLRLCRIHVILISLFLCSRSFFYHVFLLKELPIAISGPSTNSLSFASSEIALIAPSFLKNIFTGDRILGWQFFLSALEKVCHFLWLLWFLTSDLLLFQSLFPYKW